MLFVVLFVVVVYSMFVNGQLSYQGPGVGEWVVSTPESHGLNSTELEEAELATYDAVPGRRCYLAIKNGEIIWEKYYQGHNQDAMHPTMSTVKSQCSSLFGIARLQGWASLDEVISERTSTTLQCNPGATFRHVLSMVGMSEDLNNPEWTYDYTGQLCLNVISYFLEENNPYNMTLEEFKDEFWAEPLALESMTWQTSGAGILDCGGGGAETTCRDLGRTALLWQNEGRWRNARNQVYQLSLENHYHEGYTNVFPNKEREYGFGVWIQQVDTPDPWDPSPPYPGRYSMMGIFSQCAHISPDNDAIVISMGWGDQEGTLCYQAWYESGWAMMNAEERHQWRLTNPNSNEIKTN